MTDIFIFFIILMTGMLIGWFLRAKSVFIDGNTDELNAVRDRLLDSEKRESEAKIRLEEMEKRIVEEKSRLNKIQNDMENTFKALASDIVKGNSENFLKLAEDKFKSLKETSEKHLEEKKKLIDQNLDGMNKKLETITQQSAELKTSIQESKSETEKLRDTTSKLHEVLSSSQKRGQWGERMVEDILNFLGLVEHINYDKQIQVKSGEKPDYTFYLPKEKVLNMDVKFPLDHYEKYIKAQNEQELEIEKKAFLKAVKNHIKDVSKKEYIDTSQGTLDYVMLFIPNESIYGFINREDHKLVNYALKNRVLLCSPLTLYAVLSLIHQATRNFAMEEKAEEVLKLLEKFRDQWSRYAMQMEKLGRSIESTKKDFELLSGTRSRQLEKPLKKIEELSKTKSQINLEQMIE